MVSTKVCFYNYRFGFVMFLFPFVMAVVLDNGGFSVKIGYSTDEEPRFIIVFLAKNLTTIFSCW